MEILLKSGQSNKLTPLNCVLLRSSMIRMKKLRAVIALSAVLSCPTITFAQESYVASEFLEENIQNSMPSADIIALLDQTVGSAASTHANPAIVHPLRQGLYVTAIPRHSNIILRF